MKSIISNERKCYVCGALYPLHVHHIFFGTANRRKSEKYGCWIYLCAAHHNMSARGVHNCPALDQRIKEIAQKAWEAKFGDREAFREVFGRSWLE